MRISRLYNIRMRLRVFIALNINDYFTTKSCHAKESIQIRCIDTWWFV